MASTSVRIDPRALEARAGEVADLLRALANDRRLLILCRLVESGEATVGALAREVGLSQSALSQHLAKLRGMGLVETRRERQMIYYSSNSQPARTLLVALDGIFREEPPPAP